MELDVHWQDTFWKQKLFRRACCLKTLCSFIVNPRSLSLLYPIRTSSIKDTSTLLAALLNNKRLWFVVSRMLESTFSVATCFFLCSSSTSFPFSIDCPYRMNDTLQAVYVWYKLATLEDNHEEHMLCLSPLVEDHLSVAVCILHCFIVRSLFHYASHLRKSLSSTSSMSRW